MGWFHWFTESINLFESFSGSFKISWKQVIYKIVKTIIQTGKKYVHQINEIWFGRFVILVSNIKIIETFERWKKKQKEQVYLNHVKLVRMSIFCSVGANSHSSLCFINLAAWEASLEPKTQTARQYFSAVILLVPRRLPAVWSRSPRVWAERQTRMPCSKCGMRKMSQLSFYFSGDQLWMLALCRTQEVFILYLFYLSFLRWILLG